MYIQGLYILVRGFQTVRHNFPGEEQKERYKAEMMHEGKEKLFF